MSRNSTPDDNDRPHPSDILEEHDAAGLFDCALSGTSELAGNWEAPSIESLRDAFPGYEIREFLGRGGMGAVYRARQASLDRDVAIKILPPAMGKDVEFAERFRREARTLAQLNHPNVVHVYDFGEAGQAGPAAEGASGANHRESGTCFYIVMEFVEGTDLYEWLSSDSMKPREAIRIVNEVCAALEFAHGKGFIHRDIKPANVLLTDTGAVKVGDFGLAKIFGDHAKSETAEPTVSVTGSAVGTAEYMAPELLRGDTDKIDHRADIFSLGVMLYQMLTGHRPRGKFAPPSEKADVDGSVDDVVLRAIEEDPGNRFQSVREMREALEQTSAPGDTASPNTGIPWAGAAAAGVIIAAALLFVFSPWSGENREETSDGPLGFVKPPSGALTPKAFPPFVLDPGATRGADQLRTVDVATIGGKSLGVAWVSSRQLHYARPAVDEWSTADGWKSVTITSAQNVRNNISLADLDGRPAIVFQDENTLHLKLAMAKSAEPDSWKDWTIVEIDTTLTAGGDNSLAVIDGRPAIAYRDTGKGELRYAWSNDAAGSEGSWTRLTVDPGDPANGRDAGYRCLLREIHGRPAILHASFATGDVYYVRAEDAGGTAWPAETSKPFARTADPNATGKDSGWIGEDGPGIVAIWHEIGTGTLHIGENLHQGGKENWAAKKVFPADEPGLRLMFPTAFSTANRLLVVANRKGDSGTWLLLPGTYTDVETRDQSPYWRSILLSESMGSKAVAVFGHTLVVAMIDRENALKISSANLHVILDPAREGEDPFEP